MRIGGRSSSAALHRFTLKELKRFDYKFKLKDYYLEDTEEVCADLLGAARTGLPVHWRK